VTHRTADLASLAEQLCSTLRQRGETLSAAESCTGGWFAREVTQVPGASEVFWGAVVTYADAAKTELAGVPVALIQAHGAVSPEVARALAVGIRSRSGSDWAVSITGIAGPAGGSPDKPVGTVWVATAGPSGTTAELAMVTGSREEVRAGSVVFALNLLLASLPAKGRVSGTS